MCWEMSDFGFHAPNFLFNAAIYVGEPSGCSVFAEDSDLAASRRLNSLLPAAKPAERAQVVGHGRPAAVGVQPAHQHRDPVCAPAGGLGGGEDGSLPPDPGAGTAPITAQKGALRWGFNSRFRLGLELPHTDPGSDSLRAESEGDRD